LEQILPIVNQLYKSTIVKASKCVIPSWDMDKKKGDIALSNRNMTVTRTDSSGWGSVVS